MPDTESEEGNKEENLKEKKPRRKSARKTQGQIIQESLGLNPTDIQEVEKKLFIARFLDFFSEDTLEFVFKERSINQNLERMMTYMKALEVEREEEKLLMQSFESKNVGGAIQSIKSRTEEIAISRGVKGSVNKRLKRLTLYITLPMFALLLVFTLIPGLSQLSYIFFPGK
jgi:preprotein translocase subunit SecG